MAAPTIHAAAVPRFLLPKLSWSTRAVRPAALGALEARRQRSSAASRRCATAPVTAAIQQQPLQHWRSRQSQPAAGHTPALEARRHFSATAPQLRDHHFDTLKFVQRLKDEGFTEEQAEGMMKVLGDVIEERCVLSNYSKLLGLTLA